MFITELRIKEFQQHKDLTIKLNPGVNYLVGKSGCGKSTVLRAISFLLKNEPHAIDVIRPDKISDTKRAAPTSVTGVFDNGIEVEHVKSASINRYVIRKPGCEEIVYDACGVNIPEEVQAILQHTTIDIEKEEIDLNFAEQISLPFLYDKSGSFRLKLFNKITGADLIDKLVQLMNKEILGFGRDIKVEQEFITENEPKLKEVTQQVEGKQKLLVNFKEKHEIVKTNALTLQNLQKLNCSVNENNESLDITQTSLGEIKIVPQEKIEDLKLQNERLQKLRSLGVDIAEFNVDLQFTKKKLGDIKLVPNEKFDVLKSRIDTHLSLSDIKEGIEVNKKAILEAQDALKGIKVPKVDTDTLKVKISTLEALKRVFKSLIDNQSSLDSNNTLIRALIEKITISDKQYQDLLKEAKVCPTCKRSTCEDHV